MARAKKIKSKDEVKSASPIHFDSRTCFAIAFFLKEADAQAYGDYHRQRGSTYNGGYFDGMPTGRDSSFDFVITEMHQKYPEFYGEAAKLPLGTKLYAATVA